MANRDLELFLDASDVSLRQLVAAASEFGGLLSEVAKEYAGTPRDPVTWYVALEPGCISIPLRGETATDRLSQVAIHEIASSVVGGIALLGERAERPAYFTNAALSHAKSLANLVGDKLPAIKVRNGQGQTTISPSVAEHVEIVIGKPRESIGTLEGRLQALNIHDKPTFGLYDLLTDQRIECSFGKYLDLETVLAAVGRRVAVTGIIRTRPSGQRVGIEAKDIRTFPSEDDLPSAEDVRGILGSGQ